jgi:predicted methyltransferase
MKVRRLARGVWRRFVARFFCHRALSVPIAVLVAFVAFARGLPTPTPGGGPHDATVRHSFADVGHWTAVFDDPARDAWQRPHEVVAALGINAGMRVADVGAGTGYFSRYLSAAVGPTGTVLAVDTEPALITHLRQRAEQEQLANVVPVLASPDNPRLPAAGIDLVLFVNTVHHIDDRPAYFRRLKNALTPRGRVAIIDFRKEPLPIGPPPEHKLAREAVVSELAQAGYVLAEAPDILPHQYLLIFRPGREAPPSGRPDALEP